MRALLSEFIGFMASLLPAGVSGSRASVLDLWRRAAELYGSLGSMRGLAVGDVSWGDSIVGSEVARVGE